MNLQPNSTGRETSWGMMDVNSPPTLAHLRTLKPSPLNMQQNNRETSWGMLDLDMSAHKMMMRKTSRDVSPKQTRTNKMAETYGVSMEQRNALKQRRSSWGSTDILNMLDTMEDLSEEGTESSDSDCIEPATQPPPPMPRRHAMGEKQVRETIAKEATKRKERKHKSPKVESSRSSSTPAPKKSSTVYERTTTAATKPSPVFKLRQHRCPISRLMKS